MEKEIRYDCRWSGKADQQFMDDYIYVKNAVFHCGDRAEFIQKYHNNIYGESVIVVAYIDNQPSAARALWRNDIDGKEAYQPCDTCVLEICRGKGIFKEMTKMALSVLPKDAIIYNFPNNNSYPGYIKMGWKLLYDYKAKLLTSYKSYLKEHPTSIDDDYAEWWLTGKNLTYVRRFGHYFLLQKDRRPFCFRIVGEISKNTARLFHKTRFGFFFYHSSQRNWYNKRLACSHVVTRNPEVGYIPTWKGDALGQK